jgi:hypothetical protein
MVRRVVKQKGARLMTFELLNDRQPPTIEADYAEIELRLTPYVDNGWVASQANTGLGTLIAGLGEIGVKFMPVRLPIGAGRHVGATVMAGKKPPILWVNLTLHNHEEELVDTICHEAIHATGALIGRWIVLPDRTIDPVGYIAEEFVAHTGANDLAKRLGYRTRLTAAPNAMAVGRLARQLREAGYSPENVDTLRNDAIGAAAFLTRPELRHPNNHY